MMRRALRRWQTLALAGLVLISLMQAAGLRSRGIHNNDFKHLWLGAKILAEGASPYDPRIMGIGARQYGFGTINPFVYPPSTGLMLRPFAGLSFERAEAAWFWINWVLAWLCVLAGP
ncbi:hypothetical protein IIC65_09990, partial [Candidatus Sumerlaeota bacterium]|nr:hypothetical protein [Candidatus Sumerlaeota bacterium]